VSGDQTGDIPAGRTPPAPSRRTLLVGVAGGAALAGLALGWWRHRALPSTALPAPIAPAIPGSPSAAADPGAAVNADGLSALWALRVAQPQGGELDLATLRGKPLLINFWATWCAPCLREMPEIDRFHREFSPRGWQVLGLAIDGPTPVREFLARVKIGFPIGLAGLDGTDLVHTLGNPQGGLPFSVMIGANGQVLHRKMGATDFAELAAWAAKA
jgi:thiol-disulfide isomerase/thioredoxin